MKMKVIWNYNGKIPENITFESDWMNRKFVDYLIEDLMRTGRAKNIIIRDEMENEWSRKEFLKLKEELEQEPENITVYFDGGYDKENALAGLGMVVYYQKGGEDFRIRKNEKLLELDNNNEAEYAALYSCMGLLEELGVHRVPCIIKGDSQVVLKQLEGEWPCYEESLNNWLDRIEAKIKSLGIRPAYEAIGRKENKEADHLANQALQDTFIHSHSKY
ncbi:reverse transcriptase-like protein [Rossellomorea vietnamensis]|uniref:Reverse transcriptase-like protein n=1 Tax=Rossellomorea vietnamensis TaxID=218284 RepID=A0A5D4NZN5_9BACI|nr:reverse transcriptase-like protein [Rossellomorea vietnamensis]TYS18866.1 reverse transcriptase-like protein [Rossellomorea vietnamensis]